MGSTPSLALLWDDRFLAYDFGEGHPFSEVPRGLAAALTTSWAREAAVPISTPAVRPPATEPELHRFHTPDYVRFVQRAAKAAVRVPLDQGDTPSFPDCDSAAASIVGGTLQAVIGALEGPVRRYFQPAGGLHHAAPARASGFCIFNDIAIALRTVFNDGTIRRAAYVDIDVHHGDGTMYGFYDDGRLLDIDFHQDGRTIFPGSGAVEETGVGDGAGLKVNVPLSPGAGDREFAYLFDRIVPPLLEAFRPELVVLQCGVDGHEGDLLGSLRYTASTYDRVVSGLLDRSVPLVVTGGGGYHPGHVARVLGMVGRRLAGGSPPAGGEPLPSEFLTVFSERAEGPPPLEWEPAPRTMGPPPAAAERLRERIESALGRTFAG